EAAARLALCGRWHEAEPLLRRMLDVASSSRSVDHLLLALDAYRRNDGKRALEQARRAIPTGLSFAHCVLAAICADLQLHQEASSAMDVACAGGRCFDDLLREIDRHLHDTTLTSRLHDGLKKAGSIACTRSAH